MEAPVTRKYAEGEIVEYASFDQSGYTLGQVARYADVQDDPDDLLVHVHSHSGSVPGPVRESQLRSVGGTPGVPIRVQVPLVIELSGIQAGVWASEFELGDGCVPARVTVESVRTFVRVAVQDALGNRAAATLK